MPTTRSRNRKQNVILCFQGGVNLVVEIDQGDAEAYLQRIYPVTPNIVYLPNTFSCIAKFLGYKRSGSSYYQNIIKKALVEYCSNYAAGFDELCTKEFPSERAAVDWCVNQWTGKRVARLEQEQYLGISDFVLELNRSYAEFHEEFKKVLGCKPLTWHYVV
jgi:hypothetical protein